MQVLLYPTHVASLRLQHFCCILGLDPYIQRFISGFASPHTHHEHFIDPRHIDSTIHLWTAFHSMTCLGYFLPTSTSFRPLKFFHFKRLSQYQRERFRALPRHSTPRIISSPKLKNYYVLCLVHKLFTYERVALQWYPVYLASTPGVPSSRL